MVKWIVLAIVGLGLLVLVLAARPVLGRLSALLRAARRLRQHTERAAALQAHAAQLEATLGGVRERAEVAEERLTVLRARRGASEDGPAFLRH